MKQGKTDIVVLLDRSGSMATIRKDMEGGFDSYIADQRKIPGECSVTLAQFDDVYEVVYAGKPLAEVPPLSLEPRGWTALLDAFGRLIDETGTRLAALTEEERPERVLFVVITDGQENRSRELTKEAIFERVKRQTETYGWQFVYFGANQDAIAVAAGLGIDPHFAVNFQATPMGVASAVRSMSAGTSSYRSGAGYSNE